MGSILQVGAPSLASFSAFLAMAGMCLILSLYFHLKWRAMRKFHKTLTANIYDKTFSVFNPFPDARRTFHSFLYFALFSPLSAVLWTLIVIYVVLLPVLQAGLILWPVVALLCLSLMMIEEAIEVRKTANVYEKALRKGVPLARGDLAVLSILKNVIPRLIIYYLLLALLFLASFIVMPYILSTVLLAWAYFAYIIFSNASVAANAQTLLAVPVAMLLTASFLAVVWVALSTLGRVAKKRVFGFLSSGMLTSPVSGSVRRQILYEKMGEVLESYPDKIDW